MEWVETTGRTIDAALDAALDELGVDEEDVEFEVVQEPKSGVLGLGRSDARIRARVKPISREKPGERQRRRGGRKEGGSRSRGGKNGAGNGGGNGGGRPKTDSDKPDETAASSDRDGETEAGVAVSAAGAAGTSSSSQRRRRRGGRGRSGSGSSSGGGGQGESRTSEDQENGADQRAASKPGAAPKPRTDDRNRNKQESAAVSTEIDVPIEEQAAAAEEFTRGLVEAFDLGGTVVTVIEEDVVTVQVEGDNLGLLVGPKGATLHAIEELVRTVVQRQTDGHGVRIHVDVAGYRAKRRAALEEFTRGLVAKVIETGKPQALEPMSAADRKVVHDTAGDMDGVVTESDGEEPRRRVVIRRA